MLDQLSIAEKEIRSLVHSVIGTMDQKTTLLRSEGVFARYSRVFSNYISLSEPPNSNLEALKRATFIAWYEVVESPCFSGVADLPKDARERVVDILESYVQDFDSEFRWMLAHYFLIADYVFPNLDSHPQLKEFLMTEDPGGWHPLRHDTNKMSSRGLMGDYWISIFKSAA